MPTIIHGGISYKVNEDGYLIEMPPEIDLNWIEYVCLNHEIDLISITLEMKKILNALRFFYESSENLVPSVGMLKRITRYSAEDIRIIFNANVSLVGKMAGYPQKMC